MTAYSFPAVLIFATAVFANIFLTLIFTFRSKGSKREEWVTGLFNEFLLVPSFVFLFLTEVLWFRVYTIIFIAFLILELFLDYILRINFRTNRLILAPYLTLYILSFWGFIGMLFTMNVLFGVSVALLYIIHTAAMIRYEISGKRKKKASGTN